METMRIAHSAMRYNIPEDVDLQYSFYYRIRN